MTLQAVGGTQLVTGQGQVCSLHNDNHEEYSCETLAVGISSQASESGSYMKSGDSNEREIWIIYGLCVQLPLASVYTYFQTMDKVNMEILIGYQQGSIFHRSFVFALSTPASEATVQLRCSFMLALEKFTRTLEPFTRARIELLVAGVLLPASNSRKIIR